MLISCAISSDNGLNQIPVKVVPFSSSGSNSVKHLSKIRPKSSPSTSPNFPALAFGRYSKGFENRTENDWLTRDPAVVDAYTADPLCGFIPTAELFYEMMKGIEFVTDPQNISRMPKNLPVLMISGAADPVGEAGKGVIRAYSAFIAAGMEDAELRLYPGGRHEILNETNRQAVYGHVLDWLGSRV